MNDIYANKPWANSYDPHVPPELIYPEISLGERMESVCSDYPDRAALVCMGVAITYRELDALSNRFAQLLVREGCRPGDVVGYHGPNLLAGAVTVMGIHKAGCVYTGVSPLYTPEELAHQLQDCGAKVLVSFEPLAALAAKVVGGTGVKTVLVSAPTDLVPGAPAPTQPLAVVPGVEFRRFAATLAEMPAERVSVSVGLDAPALMMYTGGTTGLPKGAVATQKTVLANLTQVRTWFDMKNGEEVFLSAFPIFHAAGNGVQLLAYSLGATNVLLPNPRDFQKAVETLKQHRPTLFGHVPTVFLELMKLPEFRELDFSGVKYLWSGGSPYPAEKIRELEEVVGAGKLLEALGMTECMTWVLANPHRGPRKIGSVGLPFSDMEAKLVDPETGRCVGIGDEGELLVRGPQVMKEYHKKPDETAHALRDGWLHTGDIATMDEDGYFYVVDRLKDMISVSGLKVFSRQVDDVLAEHPAVAMAATVGLPDPARPGSEIVASAIVLKPDVDGTETLKESITEYLRGRLAPYKIPKVIEFMTQVPTSAVGKVLKRELRKIMKTPS
ncbi:MAG: AMP-binding protein [Deltaproteobacteria bacterium]|nr:AMP-binding protein [Deltaproteobacteria bacterium]